MKKPRTGTATTTEAGVRRIIRRSAATDALSSEEERALRMRYGIGLDPEASLAGKCEDDAEAAEILLEIEARLVRQAGFRAGDAEKTDQAGPSPVESHLKRKIVRALRKKS